MPRFFLRWLLPLLALGLVAGAVWQWWAGPKVQGFRVQQAALVQSVVASGRVMSGSTARVGSELTGVVSQVVVDEGDEVEAGDSLVRLRDDDQAARVREARAALEFMQVSRRPQAIARLRQVDVRLAQAEREAERRRRLAAANAIPRESLEQAEQALAVAEADRELVRLEVASLAEDQTEEIILKERLAAAEAALHKLTLRAAVAGTVVRRDVEPGDLVTPGAALLEIAQAGDRELRVPVDERNLGVVRPGQRAVIVPDAYPQESFTATLREVAPAVDPQRGTVELRLDPDTQPAYLRNDMTVTMTLQTGERDQALVVPNDMLTYVGGQPYVWVVKGGKVNRVPVVLGLRGTVMSELREGVRQGDWLIAGDDLTPGQRVRLSTAALSISAPTDASVKRETPMKFN